MNISHALLKLFYVVEIFITKIVFFLSKQLPFFDVLSVLVALVGETWALFIFYIVNNIKVVLLLSDFVKRFVSWT